MSVNVAEVSRETRVREFPYVAWRTIGERNGVVLRESGRGAPLVFVPGMTGGGQATLELCVDVVEDAAAAGAAYRMLLVDYTREAHASLDALRDTIDQLVGPAIRGERPIVWSESLGCVAVPPSRFDAAFQIRKRVLISAFGAVPQIPLRLGLIAMALSPAAIYRRVMAPMGRWLFGPAGDRPDHVFFAAVDETPPGVARRRSGWLKGRTFYDDFAATSVPSKLWLGATDHIVDIQRERAFFGQLARDRADFELAVIDGGGHVVTDTALLARMRRDVVAWVIS